MPARTVAKDRRRPASGRLLDPARIIAAAVLICDTEDIETLTIRRLAADLGVGPMTLYSYFANKDAILDGVADHVLGGFVVEPMDNAPPREVIHALATAFLAMMRAHPSVVQLLSQRVTESHRSMHAAMEDVIGRLRESGLTDLAAVRAYGMIMTYTLGFAGYQRPRPWGRSDDPDAAELRRQRTHFHASLPLPEFAHLVELSSLVTTLATDEQFYYGLDCLIDGLLARPKTVRPSRRRPPAARPRTAAAPARSALGRSC